MFRHVDLFSGIGGFALAAKWAGFKTIQFVENNEFCQNVISKNFPGIPLHEDIKNFEWNESVELLTGGFPCQPFSLAGKRNGTSDDRYLWPDFLRIIKQSKPNWIVAENVVWIVEMALDNILADLENEGYETQTVIIPACAANAPHRRDRFGLLPTVTASDATCGQILCASDTYKTTSSGTLRRYNRNGKNSSLSLGRLIRLKTGFGLHPAITEVMMGFPIGWTELNH